jgi:uncharacterized protein YcfJ
MKTLIRNGCAAIAMTLSLPIFANPNTHTDTARVTHVEPVYTTVEHRIPRETCWKDTVRTDKRAHRQSGTPVILGGVIGGLLGNELGDNRDNKRIGAVVGSILGASIASDIQGQHPSRNHHRRYEEIERCEISHTSEIEQVLDGYEVDYRYRGKNYSTFMKHHPGDQLTVSVRVDPLPR